MGDESSCKVYVSTAAEFSQQESGRRRSALYGDDRRKKTSSVL